MIPMTDLRAPLIDPSTRHHSHSRCAGAAFAALSFTALAGSSLFWRVQFPVVIQARFESVELWETAEDGRRLDRVRTQDLARDALGPASVTFTLWPEQELQSIVGFGGALTQASGTVWQKLSPRQQQRVIELYFGESGLRASLARIPINSCDFAESSYSADDVAGDYLLEHFDEALPDDERVLLPIVRAALAAGGKRVQLLASPWSPPAWMKSNDAMNGNGAPRGLRPEAAAAWALYLTRWLAAFAAHGAPVSYLTVQNEPLAPSPWEACYYNSTDQRDFISTHLGPTLARAAAGGGLPPVSLLGFDDQKDSIREWAHTLLDAHSAAAEYTAGLAYHWCKSIF